ncbi:MAG: PmoA family protein [Microbacterium sp.]
MTALSIDDSGTTVAVRDGEVELFRYTYVPDSPQFESPKPYTDPIRTRAGRVVSLFRPHDHVWHKGIAWSLPVVDDENFWGGPTFVPGRFYVQLENDGTQSHRAVESAAVDGDVARFAHELEWITQGGVRMFSERRTLTARIVSDDEWVLTFETQMTNVTDAVISIGSPTTRGRENAGYGGLFWRGPRSFTGGIAISPEGSGSGDAVRGQRHEWMAYAGRHDAIDAESVIAIVDDRENPRHPPQWFARSEEFACLNPAPFFSEELEVAPGETVVFRYAVGIADADAAAAAEVASAARDVLLAERGVRAGASA